MTSVAVVAYVVLFAAVAFIVLFIALLAGRFLRPNTPTAEKLQTYECGEPAVGSAFVQFDLRFYVVALVFIIFEVELAFFFPWAAVYGKMTRLLRSDASQLSSVEAYQALGVPSSALPTSAPRTENASQRTETLRHLALTAMADIVLFFAILLVGFGYVWNRGDLDWVRAPGRPPSAPD
jgi:NADH-quinone oxidoreductase subunit A